MKWDDGWIVNSPAEVASGESKKVRKECIQGKSVWGLELIVKAIIASYDPSLRGRMRDPSIKWAYPAFVVSEPIETYLLAKVLTSKLGRSFSGYIVHGLLPLQEYTRVDKEATTALEKISNPYNLDLKLFVGPLGMPGLTAYSSLYGIGKP
jgi:NADPH-dependent curcumin reductase CurA